VKRIVLTVIACILFMLPAMMAGQSCSTCFKEGDCRMDLHKGYNTFSQSKGYQISTRDTIEVSVVFYGQKDYIFTFCTEKNLYPVHFMIYDTETGILIYDNKDDRYIESLGVGLDVTKNLTFKITTLASIHELSAKTDQSGCLGVLFQYKNYEN